MASPNRRILVVGGGPCGAVTTYWLAKAGFNVTVIERSSQTPAYGQGIDITGPSIEIVRKMGLMETIRSRTTGEGGFAMVDDNGDEIAAIGKREEGKAAFSPTQEIEIMRGELTKIFVGAADGFENVSFRYGCTLPEIRWRSEKGVTAVLSDTGEAEDFAVIVGADGLRSKVRGLLFDSEVLKACYKPRDLYIAFFSMPGEGADVPNSHFQHAPQGRSILIRPVDRVPTRSSCYVMHTAASAKLESVLGKSTEVQKVAMAEEFADFAGLGVRAIREMREADDFYFERIAQIKLEKWFGDRCVLVGDAAYAPSPLTGQGTALAILGSYVLAGELAASPDDPSAAFGRYQDVLEDYVKKSQNIPLGGMLPRLANPWSSWGIYVLRSLFWLMAWTGAWKWFGGESKMDFALPKYDMRLV